MAASMDNETKIAHSVVKLGFIEEDEVDWWLLSSKYFPSKVGGRPSWLSLQPIPDAPFVQCDNCGGPTIFLMQVYAPLQQKEETFHRTLFLFVCTKPNCQEHNCSRNFKVCRSQLPLINNFYSSDPPNEDLGSDEDVSLFPRASTFQSVCQVCGVQCSKKCGKCKNVFYCSKDHAALDWKYNHKKECGNVKTAHMAEEKNFTSPQASGMLFEEFDLVTEDENLPSNTIKDKSEDERLEEFQSLMNLPKMKGVDGKFTEEELDKAATSETDDDRQFLKFKARIEHEPKQVLRYSRFGTPLWVSSFHKSYPEDIPPCSCGAKRVFEFQVMPQLLNYLKVDRLDASLDWGTLCVYTCAESCSIGNSYAEEFLWKQDFHSDVDKQ